MCNLCQGPCECGAEVAQRRANFWRAAEAAEDGALASVRQALADMWGDGTEPPATIDHPGAGWDANGSPL